VADVQPIATNIEGAAKYLSMTEGQIKELHRKRLLATVAPGVYLYSMLNEAAEELRRRAVAKMLRSPTIQIETDENSEDPESACVPDQADDSLESVRDRSHYPPTKSVLRGISRRSRASGPT
jgi:hypothetical protein